MLVVAEIVKCPKDGTHTIKPLFEVEDKWKVLAFGTKLVTLESALAAVEAAKAEMLKHGEVVITTNQDGQCVAVTRQDADGKILSVLWEAK